MKNLLKALVPWIVFIIVGLSFPPLVAGPLCVAIILVDKKLGWTRWNQ